MSYPKLSTCNTWGSVFCHGNTCKHMPRYVTSWYTKHETRVSDVFFSRPDFNNALSTLVVMVTPTCLHLFRLRSPIHHGGCAIHHIKLPLFFCLHSEIIWEKNEDKKIRIRKPLLTLFWGGGQDIFPLSKTLYSKRLYDYVPWSSFIFTFRPASLYDGACCLCVCLSAESVINFEQIG
jgi:hypothetical protein